MQVSLYFVSLQNDYTWIYYRVALKTGKSKKKMHKLIFENDRKNHQRYLFSQNRLLAAQEVTLLEKIFFPS